MFRSRPRTPLVLTVSAVHYNEINLDLQHGRVLTSQTSEAHLTNISVTFDLKESIKS
jgi:hypothetical protein